MNLDARLLSRRPSPRADVARATRATARWTSSSTRGDGAGPGLRSRRGKLSGRRCAARRSAACGRRAVARSGTAPRIDRSCEFLGVRCSRATRAARFRWPGPPAPEAIRARRRGAARRWASHRACRRVACVPAAPRARRQRAAGRPEVKAALTCANPLGRGVVSQIPPKYRSVVDAGALGIGAPKLARRRRARSRGYGRDPSRSAACSSSIEARSSVGKSHGRPARWRFRRGRRELDRRRGWRGRLSEPRRSA